MLKTLTITTTMSLINAIKLDECFELSTDDLQVSNDLSDCGSMNIDDDSQETIAKLEEDLSDAESDLSECEGGPSSEEFADLEKANDELKEESAIEIALLQSTLNQSHADAALQSGEFAELEAKNSNLEDELAALKKASEKAAKSAKSAAEEITNLEGDLGECEAQNIALTPAVKSFSEVESFEACKSDGLHVMSYASDDCSGDSLTNFIEPTTTCITCKRLGHKCNWKYKHGAEGDDLLSKWNNSKSVRVSVGGVLRFWNRKEGTRGVPVT